MIKEIFGKNNQSIKVAINGFGRIGRATFKAILERHPNIEIVAINDLTDTKTLAHLLKYDTAYGVYDKKVSADQKNIIINGKKFRILAVKEPASLPWKELDVDIVLECTGRFTKQADAELHLKAGAKKVIISAPCKEGEKVKTIVLGVNEEKLTKNDKVISMASCTTNCLAPVTEIIRKNFGIKKAIMTTVHSYTADQNLVDGPHKDLRRARSAAMNIIPTSTGAAKAVAATIPALAGKFDGTSLRVPTITGSLCDVIFITSKNVQVEKVNAVIKKAAKSGKLKGILEATNEQIVSSDIIGNSASSIVDLSLTKVIEGDLLKVVAWYDNEWGYSCRLGDLVEFIGKKKLV